VYLSPKLEKEQDNLCDSAVVETVIVKELKEDFCVYAMIRHFVNGRTNKEG
jgi:hypothetical protein